MTALLWPVRRQRWIWLLPPFMYVVVKREQIHLHLGIEALLGVAIVVLVARRPYQALNVLFIGLPFGTFILSALFRIGIPATVVRGMGFWKEGILAGVTVAAIARMGRERLKLDWLDKMVLAYVTLGVAYLLLPRLLVGTAIGSSLSFYARELGWRSDVAYFGVFLICRHVGLKSAQVWALFRRVLVVEFVIAAIGVYEFFAPWSFNSFVVNVIRYPAYQALVLHSPVGNPHNILAFGTGGHLVRIGSVFINNLPIGFYLILGLGIATEMVSRGRGDFFTVVSIFVIGAAVIFTQARAAIIGGALAIILGLRAQIGRSIVNRVRLSSMLAFVAFGAVPVMIFGGLARRFLVEHKSNNAHVHGIRGGLHIMAQYPLGRGLATGSGGGQVAAGKGIITSSVTFIPENQWLQIGTQLGIIGLVIYSVALLLMLGRLRPITRDLGVGVSEPNICGGGSRIALIGILMAGLFAQPFNEPVVPWTVFGLCGLAAFALDQSRLDDPEKSLTLPGVHHPALGRGSTV